MKNLRQAGVDEVREGVEKGQGEQRGGHEDHLVSSIHENGHIQFLERNSDQLQGYLRPGSDVLLSRCMGSLE